jgi:hypothetical protein
MKKTLSTIILLEYARLEFMSRTNSNTFSNVLISTTAASFTIEPLRVGHSGTRLLYSLCVFIVLSTFSCVTFSTLDYVVPSTHNVADVGNVLTIMTVSMGILFVFVVLLCIIARAETPLYNKQIRSNNNGQAHVRLVEERGIYNIESAIFTSCRAKRCNTEVPMSIVVYVGLTVFGWAVVRIITDVLPPIQSTHSMFQAWGFFLFVFVAVFGCIGGVVILANNNIISPWLAGPVYERIYETALEENDNL